MEIKPSNSYKCLNYLKYIILIMCLLHVSATLVAILREVYQKGYITKHFETMHKYEILSLKMYGLRYVKP
jgi:hypothetical protein